MALSLKNLLLASASGLMATGALLAADGTTQPATTPATKPDTQPASQPASAPATAPGPTMIANGIRG